MKRSDVIVALVTVGLILAGGYFGFRYMLIGRLTTPSNQEYAQLAQPWVPVVQAIYDFEAERGLAPDELVDLVPEYLPELPGRNARLSDRLLIRTPYPRTYIYYYFGPPNGAPAQPGLAEGWHVSGDWGNGDLPLPKQASTRPALTGEALVQARLAEYDRRIASRPEEKRHRARTMAYLHELGRTDEALASAEAAAEAFPDWWRPQMLLAVLAPEGSRPEASQRLWDWAKQRPAFIHYWLISKHHRDLGEHDRAIAALEEAVKHPLQDIGDLGWVPNAFAFDAAAYALEHEQYALVLAITRVWSAPVGVYSNPGEDLLAFRAAANLALGNFEDAERDAVRVADLRGLWAENLQELKNAAIRRDQSFRYDPGSFLGEWTLHGGIRW